MLAHEMMSDVVPALKLTDSAYKALNWMEVFRLSHLPVVKDGHFIGIISDDTIYDSGIFNESIETIADRIENYYVTSLRHIFDIINLC
ncbi:MAG: CBS domain-containing protein, partial [Salinivirgaceae bacterium]|nr:CBS domain-containing protein [Salinivirgaceae bacterium]